MPNEANSSRDPRRFVYKVDASDRIVYVNRAWLAFASENGLELSPDNVLGKPLGDFVSNAELQLLFGEIHRAVRRTRRSLRFNFRCDSPDRRRFMEMRLVPLPGAGIAYHTRILQSERRKPIRFEETPERSREIISVCSWCKKVHDPSDNWIEFEDAVQVYQWLERENSPMITHGICPSCLRTLEAELLRVKTRS